MTDIRAVNHREKKYHAKYLFKNMTMMQWLEWVKAEV